MTSWWPRANISTVCARCRSDRKVMADGQTPAARGSPIMALDRQAPQRAPKRSADCGHFSRLPIKWLALRLLIRAARKRSFRSFHADPRVGRISSNCSFPSAERSSAQNERDPRRSSRRCDRTKYSLLALSVWPKGRQVSFESGGLLLFIIELFFFGAVFQDVSRLAV